MYLLAVLLLLSKLALCASSSLTREAPKALTLLSPSANSTRSNSALPEGLTGRTSFPIENTSLTLIIYDTGKDEPLLKPAVRTLLEDAHSFVSNLIDIAGDGYLPPSADPYEAKTEGAYIVIATIGAGPHKLKWSHLKDTLWGLRDFMVVQEHLFDIGFFIRSEELHVEHELGFGRVEETPGPYHHTNK